MVSPSTIATLSAGEFVGILADEPGREMPLKAFHGRLVKEPYKASLNELSVVREVTTVEVDEYFKRVKKEVVELVVREMGRMLGIRGRRVHCRIHNLAEAYN